MTAETFEVIEINDVEVHVRHVEDKHVFSYGFVEDSDGKVQLSERPVYIIEVADMPHDAAKLFDEARSFAEKEARSAGRLE
jgi:hypothetical protein